MRIRSAFFVQAAVVVERPRMGRASGRRQRSDNTAHGHYSGGLRLLASDAAVDAG